MASENASAQRIVHVIDDDEGLRESLAFLLRSAELEVRSFDSAKAFLDELPDVALGCVITDVRMPDMSGIELLRRLKELKIGVPVIVITGHGDIALAVEAMKIGAADFFEKPFDDDLLVARRDGDGLVRMRVDEAKRSSRPVSAVDFGFFRRKLGGGGCLGCEKGVTLAVRVPAAVAGAGPGLAGSAPCPSTMWNSTRRLLRRPSSVEFVSIGRS